MHRLMPSRRTSGGGARREGAMIRTACALALLALGFVLTMSVWPDIRIVTACMFVGQGALALGIAVFIGSEYRRLSSGDERPSV